MAYLRSLSTRAIRIGRAYNQPFSYVLSHPYSDEDSPNRTLPLQQKTIGRRFNNSFGRPVGFFHGKTAPLLLSLGWNHVSGFVHYTTDGKAAGNEIEFMSGHAAIEFMSDQAAADVTAQVVTNHVPVLNEVAIAATDSFLPVAGAQHFIDAVHTFTGLNWWASIAVSALLVDVANPPSTIEIAKITEITPRKQDIASTADASNIEKLPKIYHEL